MYAVRFNYPPTPASPDGLTDEERIALELAKGRDGRARNSDYWFCGNAAVRPVGAFDDGVQTRITFAPRGELPALFVLNDDGTESLLNFSIDQGDVLIHRVAARFIVRRGRLTGCIVNQGFGGTVYKLAGLFSLDSFAGGLAVFTLASAGCALVDHIDGFVALLDDTTWSADLTGDIAAPGNFALDANGPVKGLVGSFRTSRGRKYFKGPKAPRLGDLAYTETVIFGP